MRTTTITNISNQIIPILVGSTTLENANPDSSVDPLRAEQVSVGPGSQLTIEVNRVDVGQLDQLRRKQLISYTSF